jgi:hypothetical protein
VTATPPELAENATVTPEIKSFAEFRASTVIVAVVVPSAEMDDALDIAVSEAGVTVGVVVPVPVPVVPVPVVVDPVVLVPVSPVIDLELPPQAASTRAPTKTSIDNLRMLASLSRRYGGCN